MCIYIIVTVVVHCSKYPLKKYHVIIFNIVVSYYKTTVYIVQHSNNLLTHACIPTIFKIRGSYSFIFVLFKNTVHYLLLHFCDVIGWFSDKNQIRVID